MRITLRKLTLFWPLIILPSFPTLTPAETAVQAWAQRYNGLGNGPDLVHAMAVDSSNNVIVTGTSTGSGSGYDYATIKYSSAVTPLWTNRFNGPANGIAAANAWWWTAATA